MRKFGIGLLAGLLLFAWNGCRSHKGISETEFPVVWEDGSPQALFVEMLTRHEGDTTAVVKTTANVSLGRNSVRSKVQIRWQRDEAIQFSIIPLLGMEIFRIVVTPDTLYFIDRLRKQYAVEPYAKWQNYVPFDISFTTVQSIFLSQPFLPGGQTQAQNVRLFEITEQDDNYQYVYTAPRPAVGYRFEADTRGCLAVADMYTAARSRALTCRYFDYRQQDSAVCPQRMSCLLEGFLSENVALSFENLIFEWNTPQNISTGISAKYTKITDLESWVKDTLR